MNNPTIGKHFKKAIVTLVVFLVFGSIGTILAAPLTAYADSLPLVRVFYRPDGGVSITTFSTNACREKDTVKDCMDRITLNNDEKDLPYDDMRPEDLPPDRSMRDKWRGEQGRGIWIDTSLVTKSDKYAEYQMQIDEELDKEEPNYTKVLKLQRLVEKVNDLPHTILSEEDIQSLEGPRGNVFSTISRGVGRIVAGVADGIKNGVLALQSLVTQTLSVGSSIAPAGITIYDTKTGEPFCVVVESGSIRNLPGTCEGQVAAVSSGEEDNPLSPPDPIIPPGGDGASDAPQDSESPVITVQGSNPATVNVGDTYADLGATVTDNVDQNLGIVTLLDGVEVVSITIDTPVPGTHIIEYRATDQAGNAGGAMRTLIVSDPFLTPLSDTEPVPEPELAP